MLMPRMFLMMGGQHCITLCMKVTLKLSNYSLNLMMLQLMQEQHLIKHLSISHAEEEM